MRLIYLDESGTSTNEEVAVVAGVILDFDKDAQRVEDALAAMRTKHLPANAASDFSFHSTELYNGFKKKHPLFESGISRDDRWATLDALCAAPEQLDLALVYGGVRKSKFCGNAPENQSFAHAAAFAQALLAAETWLEQRARPGELAIVVAENKPEIHATLREAHRLMRNAPPSWAMLGEWALRSLPLRRVRDVVHFADKRDAEPLQLADACAWSIRRYAEESKDADRFIASLLGGPIMPRSFPECRVRPVFGDWLNPRPRKQIGGAKPAGAGQ